MILFILAALEELILRIEDSILNNLIHNEEFAKTVLPFLKQEYFTTQAEKFILEEIQKFNNNYYKAPTIDSLRIDLSNRIDIGQTDLNECNNLLDAYGSHDKVDTSWLIDKSEKFCKDRAIYNAIQESIYIMDSSKATADSIPSILSDALAVSFDSHVGHDYINDFEKRYEFYHRVEEKIPFDLDIFNKITGDGLPKKTLSCVISGPGGGKSLFMCHHAASVLSRGKNVLYITMEMAEERIAERIDANLFNVNIKDLKHMDKQSYENKIDRIKAKTQGQLIIKEYPTGNAHAGHFDSLIRELKMKRDFVPDLVIIDYLNICSSRRIKMGGSVNTYSYVKFIAEELRSLAIQHDVPILTATQTNREGITASDMDMTNTSESIGLPQTLDFFFALIRTEELDGLRQILVKQLKNRYNDPAYYKKFVIGVDFAKMKLYDVEQNAQEDISDSGTKDDRPLFDKSTTPERFDFKF